MVNEAGPAASDRAGARTRAHRFAVGRRRDAGDRGRVTSGDQETPGGPGATTGSPRAILAAMLRCSVSSPGTGSPGGNP